MTTSHLLVLTPSRTSALAAFAAGALVNSRGSCDRVEVVLAGFSDLFEGKPDLLAKRGEEPRRIAIIVFPEDDGIIAERHKVLSRQIRGRYPGALVLWCHSASRCTEATLDEYRNEVWSWEIFLPVSIDEDLLAFSHIVAYVTEAFEYDSLGEHMVRLKEVMFAALEVDALRSLVAYASERKLTTLLERLRPVCKRRNVSIPSIGKG